MSVVVGYNQPGDWRVFCYQYGGETKSGSLPSGDEGIWRCLSMIKLSSVEWLDDPWRTEPHGPQHCVGHVEVTPTTILVAIRRKGNEVVAAVVGARSRCGSWQSSADYVARGGCGDPRGRKSGGSSGADSPTWPARTEGEKRVRSLIRNP